MEQAAPMYLTIDGVKDSVTADGHKGWIELESCDLGVDRKLSNPTGRGVNRESGVPHLEVALEDTLIGSFHLSSQGGDGKPGRLMWTRPRASDRKPWLGGAPTTAWERLAPPHTRKGHEMNKIIGFSELQRQKAAAGLKEPTNYC
jgi:hypothetical protein